MWQTLLQNASVILLQNASVILWQNASVILWQNASVILLQNASVILLQNTSVILLQNVTVNFSRLGKFLPNSNYPQPCSKKYHHSFVWCLKLKINEF